MLLLCRVCYEYVVMCYTLILWKRIKRINGLPEMNYFFETKNSAKMAIV
jgi:hypothetical protein